MARLRTLGAWLMHSSQDAEDLVQSALARVFDPQGSPWDPHGKKTFVLHVGAEMNNLASNERQSFYAQHVEVDSTLARDERTVDGAPLADEALHKQRRLAHWRELGSELLADLDKTDPTGAAVYRAICKGAEGHAEIAAEAGCKEEEVRFAYDRIRYHARPIVERDRRAQLAQMRERRQRSKSGSSKKPSGPRGPDEQA
jgi:DNA-directed RNA polymerase specialized sigma24 family protein